MMKYLSALIILFAVSTTFAQTYTVSGTLKDSTNGEDMFGGAVIVKELSNVGATVNSYGFYSLTLEKGEYTLMYRSSGYETKEIKINLVADMTLNVELALPKDVQEMEAVEVTGEKANDNITSSGMNVTKFDPKDIEMSTMRSGGAGGQVCTTVVELFFVYFLFVFVSAMLI